MNYDKAIEIVGHKGYGYPEDEIREAFGMAVEAMEKQKPKGYDMADNGTFICQMCHKPITKKLYPKYCGYCGYPIDWSEVKE